MLVIDMRVEVDEQSVRIYTSWNGINKIFWVKYPSGIEITPESACLIPYGIALPIICMSDDKDVKLSIRGTFVNSEIVKIFGLMVQERYAAYWDAFKRSKLFSYPYVVVSGEKGSISETESFSNAGLNFSFGKESNLTRRLAQEIYSSDKCSSFFVENSTYNKLANRDLYPKYSDLCVVRSNMNHISGIIAKSYPLEFSSFSKKLDPGSGSTDVFNRINVQYSFLALPLILTKKIKYWLQGNEFDTTHRVRLENGGFHYYFDLFDESLYYEWIYTNLFGSLIPGFVFYSPISSLEEKKIIEIIIREFPEDLKNVRGCWHGSKTTVWCGQCLKCRLYYIILLSLGKVPHFDFHRSMDHRLDRKINPDHYNEVSDRMAVDRLSLVPDHAREIIAELFLNRGECDPYDSDTMSYLGPDLDINRGSYLTEFKSV